MQKKHKLRKTQIQTYLITLDKNAYHPEAIRILPNPDSKRIRDLFFLQAVGRFNTLILWSYTSPRDVFGLGNIGEASP